MTVYAYKARSLAGQLVEGELEAENTRAVYARLRDQQLAPTTISEKEAGDFSASFRSRLRGEELGNFVRELSDLLLAGVSLGRALDVLYQHAANKRVQGLVGRIRETVVGGSSLAAALEQHPRTFAPLLVQVVQAGETGGFLADSLRRFAVFLDRQRELRSRVISAMLYPAILIFVGFASVVFLMVYFVPRFVVTFKEMGGDALPWPTRVLMGTSDLLTQHFPALVGGLAFVVLLFWRALESERGRLIRDQALLHIPVVRRVVTKLAIARFARSLGTLLSSGVAILTALRISRSAASNLVFQQQIAKSIEDIRTGDSLSGSLARGKAFPRPVIEMLAVGQQSGRLNEVLLDIADRYDADVNRALSALVAVIEPLLIVVMAVIVGFTVIAILFPLLSMGVSG